MSIASDQIFFKCAEHRAAGTSPLQWGNPLRILLVDDEPSVLTSLHGLLKERGYGFISATNVDQAIDQLSATPFELVLLNLRRPYSNGYEVLDYIREHDLDASLIMLPAETEQDGTPGKFKRGTCQMLLQAIDGKLQQRMLEQENRRIAVKLEESEKRYRYLIDSSPDFIYTLDQDGQFSFINERASQLLGYSRDQLLGKHYSTVVHEADLSRAQYVFNERRVGNRASRNIELRLKPSVDYLLETASPTTPITLSFNSTGMYSTQLIPDLLQPAFSGTYGFARDVTETKRAHEFISYQAYQVYHDVLTDLPNRVLFKDRLGMAMIQADRNASELAVLFVDLDRFKLVNDSLGHINGDELLQQAARRLKESLRRGDTLARLGGDEFTIFLPELSTREDAQVVAEKFLECLRKAFILNGQEVYISASIGIAIYPTDGESIDDLLCHADIAMYHVKANGKNGCSFYAPHMQDASYQKITLEYSLRRALELGELEMYYQPQIDVNSGDIVGAEGLMRWNHPERGVLTAGEFLPFAEENGLMISISDWMLETLCRDLAHWSAVQESSIRLSLNLSPHYLERGDFVSKMRAAFKKYAISPSQIEIEITENICIRNLQYAIEQLNQLCELGVSVAIDDFGTGYSSLAYLHRFPIHTIKIDQSFVMQIQSSDGHFPVVLAIISIAKGLGLNLVAEGVETEIQADYLQQSGCSIMQGFLYHRAVPRDTFVALLSQQALNANSKQRLST